MTDITYVPSQCLTFVLGHGTVTMGFGETLDGQKVMFLEPRKYEGDADPDLAPGTAVMIFKDAAAIQKMIDSLTELLT
jgi:hypothetical protein